MSYLRGTRAVAGKFQLFCGTHRSKTPGLSTVFATVVSGREHPQRHADFVGRVHPDGTRTSHTLPLPPFTLPCARARGEQTPTQLTGRLERGALTQAPFVRTAGARTVRLRVWFQHDVFSSLQITLDVEPLADLIVGVGHDTLGALLRKRALRRTEGQQRLPNVTQPSRESANSYASDRASRSWSGSDASGMPRPAMAVAFQAVNSPDHPVRQTDWQGENVFVFAFP